MLEDRDYMREPEYQESRVSFTVALLIVNAAVFLVQLAASNSLSGTEIEFKYFALSLAGLKHGYVWQLLTFQFMHAGWMHILCNSLMIYFFGQPVEMALGRRHFLTLYLVERSHRWAGANSICRAWHFHRFSSCRCFGRSLWSRRRVCYSALGRRGSACWSSSSYPST